MVTVAVVGSRFFPSEAYAKGYLTGKFAFWEVKGIKVKVVSGGAFGPDTWAKEVAQEFNLPFQEILPDWKLFGKSAGFKRNTQLVQDANVVIAFWDGKSNGTRDSINKARDFGKLVIVVAPDGGRTIYRDGREQPDQIVPANENL